jgi:hypothetical protein
MDQRPTETLDRSPTIEDNSMSRRAAMASGVAALALLSGSAVEGEQMKKADAGKTGEEARKQAQERAKIMAEDRTQRQRQAIDDFKGPLGISDTDWPVVKPRIEAVYNLVHPSQQFGPGGGQPKTEVQQRSDELRELLRDEKTPAEQIKGKLAAFRAAKEKANHDLVAARRNLRQVMTLRREAQLILDGLLD